MFFGNGVGMAFPIPDQMVGLHVPGKIDSIRLTKFQTRPKAERGKTRWKRPFNGVRQVGFIAIPYLKAVPVISRPDFSLSSAFVSAWVATLSTLATAVASVSAPAPIVRPPHGLSPFGHFFQQLRHSIYSHHPCRVCDVKQVKPGAGLAV
jgi:hypothetical protein